VRAAADRRPALEGWSAEVEAFLLRHPWPGNARELENAIERGVALARGPKIELEDLLLDGESERGESAAAPGAEEKLAGWLDGKAAERIRDVLADSRGSRAEAARRLGVDRTTLWRWMQRLGIDG
jgi:DNA-binding NtrC family response regulator